MQFILGIDAAWTEREPSGVALIVVGDASSKVLCVAPSYQQFIQAGDGAPIDWGAAQIRGSVPDLARLLSAARNLGANSVDLVAMDIPLARTPITSRRASDRAVSRAYGAKGCSTHSPSATRPGPISDELGRQLVCAGYTLETNSPVRGSGTRAIEVYPHPALITLTNRDYRVPYKVARTTRYWEGMPIQERTTRLLTEFQDIYRHLEADLGALPFALPSRHQVSALAHLKRFEDALDALVCAWVAKRHLLGQTSPYGDEDSTIWIP